MNSRERFRRTMHFEPADHFPLLNSLFLGIWSETVNRWYGEGLPTGMTVHDYFGFEKGERFSIDFGPLPAFITETVQEDERYRVDVTRGGGLKCVTRYLKTSTSMPQFVEYLIKTRNDWEIYKKRLDPHDPRRYPRNWSEELIEYYNNVDHPVSLDFATFHHLRSLMGPENLLKMFFKNPELVHEMFDFITDFQIETSRMAVESVKFDLAMIHEDIAYKKGPMISPKFFREFILPNYKKLTGFLRKNGIDTIIVDSDGDLHSLIPLFLEGGVNGFLPLEVQAGMDAVELRKTYGKRLVLVGNIDKRALAQGKEAMEKEVNYKVPYLTKEGGYIPTVDHNVPSDVSFQNYVYYINLLKKYMQES